MNKSLEQEIDCLKIKEEGIRLEYEYVTQIKNEQIEILKSTLEQQKKENKYLTEQLKEIQDQLKDNQNKLEKIEYSRWWKLRKILKGEK